MPVEIDLSHLPTDSQLEVNIRVTAALRVTASEARRRVSRLLASEIGNLLYGDEPTLVVGERICWRVPAVLAFPDSGPVGQAGALDVDSETGAILTTSEQLSSIAENARRLAERTSIGTA